MTDLDAVFHALSNGARREILGRLAEQELTVGELAEPLTMTLAAASKHIKVLERVGLIEQTITGRRHVCRLVAQPLAPAAAWLDFYERHWADRLDALEDLFRSQPDLKKQEGGPMTDVPTVTLHRVIPAAPHQVYRAWLEPDLLRRWLAPGELQVTRIEVDERVGGKFRVWHGMTDGGGGTNGGGVGGFECELLELVPDERLVFRWGFVGPERTAGPVFDSLLTITLANAPDGATALTLVHQQLDALHEAMPQVSANVGHGWDSVLEKLAASVATDARC
jgi:uncharacterized protein YndB with AHSA1/START domain/DNA-binding transcriptional ArsR family regulator